MNELLGPNEEIDVEGIWGYLIDLVRDKAESSEDVDPFHLPNYEADKRALSTAMISKLEQHDLNLALNILTKNPIEKHQKYAEILCKEYGEQRAA